MPKVTRCSSSGLFHRKGHLCQAADFAFCHGVSFHDALRPDLKPTGKGGPGEKRRPGWIERVEVAPVRPGCPHLAHAICAAPAPD